MADESIGSAVARLAAHVRRREELVAAIEGDDASQPGAQSFEQDRTSGHTTLLHCWDHDRDPAECHRLELLCTGEPIPTATDSAGELAIERVGSGKPGSVSWLATIEKAEADVIAATKRLRAAYTRFLPSPLSLEPLPRGQAGDGDPGCESCSRLNLGTKDDPRWWWNEANYNRGRPTNFGGALTSKKRLCRACAEWALDHDHERLCVDANDKPLDGKARYPHAIHLPPVDDPAGQSLRKKHATGYWSGKPARPASMADQRWWVLAPSRREVKTWRREEDIPAAQVVPLCSLQDIALAQGVDMGPHDEIVRLDPGPRTGVTEIEEFLDHVAARAGRTLADAP